MPKTEPYFKCDLEFGIMVSEPHESSNRYSKAMDKPSAEVIQEAKVKIPQIAALGSETDPFRMAHFFVARANHFLQNNNFLFLKMLL